MRFKNLDLIVVMVIVAINIVWTQIPNRVMLAGVLFVLPLILFVPGYTLVQVLFGRRVSGRDEDSPVASDASFTTGTSGAITSRLWLNIGHPVGKTDQIILSLGLSIAIDVLMGFALNFLPGGLNGFSWVVALSVITMVCSLLAIILRRRDAPSGATIVRMRITVLDVLLFALAILVVCSAIWLSLIRPINPQPSFTQFWILPANQANKTCTVTLGIQSFETNSERYRVVMNVNNTRTNAWSSIAVDPQQKWVQSVSITPGTGSTLYVEAQLYRLAKPDVVYRNVHLTFYISSVNLNGLIRQQCLIGNQG